MATDRSDVLRQFGMELKRRRQAAGYRFAKDFAEAAGISPQYVSQLERAYSTEGRPPTEPEADKLEKISRALGWPMTDIHRTLGRLSDVSYSREYGEFVVLGPYDLTPDQEATLRLVFQTQEEAEAQTGRKSR